MGNSRKDKMLEQARSACTYVNSLNIKSSTKIGETNHQLNLRVLEGLNDIRKKEMQGFLQPPHSIEHPDFYHFDQSINQIKDYSLGNCREYAMLALDYLLRAHPDLSIPKEIFMIGYGDHAFVVLGRMQPDSVIEDPSTWGPDAVICDPWSNQVFAASEYKEKLKNYFFDEEDKRNKLQDISEYHELWQVNSQAFLDHKRTVDILKTNFNKKIEEICTALKLHYVQLGGNKPQNQLTKDQIALLKEKAQDLEKLFKELPEIAALRNSFTQNSQYDAAKQALEEKLQIFSNQAEVIKQKNEVNSSLFSFLKIFNSKSEIDQPKQSNLSNKINKNFK